MADLVITAASVVVVAGAEIETENGMLGETVTAGQALYETAAKTWMKADNNAATARERRAKGIALNGGAIGQPVRILKRGQVTIGATLTANTAYYLSDTPGGICLVADLAAGEHPILLGFSASTTVLAVDIRYAGGVL